MNNRTRSAIERQIVAMGADVFEVGLFKPRTPSDPHTEPEMLPRVWDRETLLRSVSWLCCQNAHGRNVYIRPKGEHHLSLVDDLPAQAIHRMKVEGFAPALVVETSPGNFQAWLNHGQPLPKHFSTIAARTLAERFGGDKGAADWRHFGRLAGLTNRKEKYRSDDGRYPFVRLVESTGSSYSARAAFIQQVSAQISSRTAPTAKVPHLSGSGKPRLSINDFRSRMAYDGDGNRIDLAYAVYAFAHGASEEEVRSAIASRDLSKKGSEQRQSAYVEPLCGKLARRWVGDPKKLAAAICRGQFTASAKSNADLLNPSESSLQSI